MSDLGRGYCVKWCNQPSSGCDAYISADKYDADPAEHGIVKVHTPNGHYWCAEVDTEQEGLNVPLRNYFNVDEAENCGDCSDT